MTRDLHALWEIIQARRDVGAPELHRLTAEDLTDDAIRAATVVAITGLGTDRLTALLDLRDDLASGDVDRWIEAWAQDVV